MSEKREKPEQFKTDDRIHDNHTYIHFYSNTQGVRVIGLILKFTCASFLIIAIFTLLTKYLRMPVNLSCCEESGTFAIIDIENTIVVSI